jgi:hypothetical protein
MNKEREEKQNCVLEVYILGKNERESADKCRGNFSHGAA